MSAFDLRRTSAFVPTDAPTGMFDMELRALRRDRAFRSGPELFLHQRAFDDCLDRLGLIRRRFKSALMIGCPRPDWPGRLKPFAQTVEAADPGPLFAKAAGGTGIVEDRWDPPPAAYDLILSVGTLDTVNDLPRALRSLRSALADDSLLIGAMAGGETIPRLRLAMRAADRIGGGAQAHVHPRVEAASLAPLLSACGFVMPVVDVDRVQASYRSLRSLVADLRRMAATSILSKRPRTPLLRQARAAAEAEFGASGDGERTVETFEILHFAAWSPASDPRRSSGLRPH